MAAKTTAWSIYPEPELAAKIEKLALKERRGKGPMALEIIRRYFAAVKLGEFAAETVVKKEI